MSDKGEMLGIIENLVADTKTGNIDSIIINPHENINPNELNKDRKLIVPFKNIKAIRDVVVVERWFNEGDDIFSCWKNSSRL